MSSVLQQEFDAEIIRKNLQDYPNPIYPHRTDMVFYRFVFLCMVYLSVKEATILDYLSYVRKGTQEHPFRKLIDGLVKEGLAVFESAEECYLPLTYFDERF